MPSIRCVTCSVGYDDLLAITLPQNARHFSEVYVVTDHKDERTLRVVESVPNARVHVTDDFYSYGAKFNKGLALEGAFQAIGRHGWIAVVDADTLLPDDALFNYLTGETIPDGLVVGRLYSSPRRMLTDPKLYRPGCDWGRLPKAVDRVFPGYFHLFHADDPHLTELPWYDVTFSHAGGGDGFFQSRWEVENKVHLPFDVLHLGPRDANWFGRCSPRSDGVQSDGATLAHEDMKRYKTDKGWIRGPAGRRVDPKLVERVEVPGHRPRKWLYGPGSEKDVP